MVGSPTQAEPLAVRGAPDQVHRSRRLQVGEAHSRSSCPGTAWRCPARRSPPARRRGRAPDRRRPTATTARLRGPRSPSPREPARSRAPTVPAPTAPRGETRPRPAWRRRASASAAATISSTPAVPTSPVRRGGADRSADDRDDADRAPPVLAVGRGRVQREADVDVAALLDQHHAAVGARSAPPAARPRSTSSWAGITGRPARSPSRLLAGVQHPHAAHEHRRAPVRHRRHLTRLALAAVERTAEHPGRLRRPRPPWRPRSRSSSLDTPRPSPAPPACPPSIR